MREMKDSGIEWIGEIPTNWKLVPLKYLLSNEIDSLRVGPFGSTLKGTDFTNEGYWVYNQRTVLDCNFDANDTFISEEKYHTMTGFQIRYNDILITTRGTIGKICRIPKKYYKGIIHPCIIKFRINEDKVLYPYLELIFNSSNLFQTQLTYKSNATTIEVIYSGTLKNLLVPIPASLTLQKQISKYLIQRCNKIDSIVNDIQHQIELLQEYKQSVITEAVTKGLDKNVAMKDSGIKWIGDIPEDWTIGPFYNFLDDKINTIVDGPFGSNLKNEEYVDEGVPVIQLGAIRDNGMDFSNMHYVTEEKANLLKRHNASPNDIVIAKMMPAGKACEVSNDYERYVVSADVVKASVANDEIRKFLVYALNVCATIQAQIEAQGSTRARVNIGKIKRFKIPHPPQNDQMNAIVKYLDQKCSEIDAIIADKQKQLDKLNEYKKSLIYEYVTGKKEVPADA